MAQGYGMAGAVGWSKEVSGGTAVTAANFIEALSENLSSTYDRFETKNIINRLTEADDDYGIERISGNLVAAAHPVEVGHFLQGAFGVQSGTEVASGVLWLTEHMLRTTDWDNVYPNQPFTFEMNRDVSSSQQYAGCNINALEFNVAPNQDLRMTVGLMGTSQTDITPTAVSYTNSPTGPFTFDTASLQLAGSANAKLESFRLAINHQLQGIASLNNSRKIRAMRRNGPITVRAGGTIAFEDFTEYKDFINQTERVFQCSVFKANSFSMIFDMPRFVYTSFPLGVAGRGRQVVNFSGTARYHVGSASPIKVSLTTTNSWF